MPQNQEQIEARLAAYIDGELDATERAEIEKHLANNPQHKQLIDELTGQRDLLRALPREKAPAEIAETIHSQLERSVLLGKAGEDTAAAALRINRWPHRGAIAAIVLLTAGLGFLVYKVLPSNKPPAEFAVAPREQGPATAPLTEDAKAEKPIEVASGSKELEKSLPAAATPAPAPTAAVAPEPAPAPSVALAPTPAPTPALTPAPSPVPEASAAPTPERISKAGEATDIAAATPPASTPPPANTSGPPAVALNEDTLPGTVQPGAAPTTPPAVAGKVDDQGKVSPLPDGLAMKNGFASNSASAANQPLANAMKQGEESRKGGESNLAGGFAGGAFGGGGGAGAQQPFGAALANANGSITLVVSTDNPSLAGDQVKAYCEGNGIAWEPTPAPASITYAQQDYTRMNRLRSQQATVSTGQPMAKAAPDEKYRYSAKDVQGNRRTEMQSLDRGGALSDESAAKKEPATQRSFADSEAAQAKPAVSDMHISPTTQPASGAAQVREDDAAEHLAYFCRSVTPQQAHELEDVLSARPGQSAQVLPQALDVDRSLDLNVQADALPTTAPSTQPLAGPIGQANQPAAPSDGSTMKEQIAQPMDKLGTGGGILDLRQSQVAQQQMPAAQQAAEPRVDLLVVVRRDASAATQPTQQLESPPANAAEPLRQSAPAKSP